MICDQSDSLTRRLNVAIFAAVEQSNGVQAPPLRNPIAVATDYLSASRRLLQVERSSEHRASSPTVRSNEIRDEVSVQPEDSARGVNLESLGRVMAATGATLLAAQVAPSPDNITLF